MQRLFSLILVFVAMTGLGVAPAQEVGETRVALIIANETYASPPNFQPLPGTQQDATVMEAALRQAGFDEIAVERNLGREAMRAALEQFAARLEALGESGVGFLYYSGHGIGQDGENWLLPVDVPHIDSATQLPSRAVPLSEHLRALAIANARSVIIVLDACRTSFGRGSRGLVAVEPQAHTLVAFSTYQNSIANDDGLYARVLAEELTRPGATSVNAFARVTERVAVDTGGQQVPRYDNGLITPLVFVPSEEQPVPPEDAPDALQTPPDQRAPLVRSEDVSRLRDFALFRECEVCPEMVVLPAGSFLMGSPQDEAGRDDNEDDQAGPGGAQVRVSVQRVAVGRFELTTAEWYACVEAGGGCYDRAPGRQRVAVNTVSWYDAQTYFNWLHQQLGGRTALVSSGGGGPYRLLSEAEWEYAARAGSTTRYGWGDQDPVCEPGAANGAHFRECNDYQAHQVGSSGAANRFGLYDMHGNVYELVQDCYADFYTALPTYAVYGTGNCSALVIRGGSWYNWDLRSAHRRSVGPAVRDDALGFRVARTL